jgi:oxidoreductase
MWVYELCFFIASAPLLTPSPPLVDVINAAKAAKLDIEQRLIYCSVSGLHTQSQKPYCTEARYLVQSMGADPKSFFPCKRPLAISVILQTHPYAINLHTDPRSKGLTEAELTSLGYKETIIFRPGMLRPVGGRDHPRMVEAIAGFFTKNVLSHLSDNAEIQTDLLGKAMMLAGEMGIVVCLKNGFGKMTKLGNAGQEVSIRKLNEFGKPLMLIHLQALVISNAEAAKLAKIDL